MSKRRPQSRSGWFFKLFQAMKAKWKLADERDQARHELHLKAIELEAAEDRLEIYKDALVAANRRDRLEGLAFQQRIDQMSEMTEPGTNRR